MLSSWFFGAMVMDNAKFDVEGKMPAFSKSAPLWARH